MKQGSLTLVPETEYGIPSGNYDGSSETSFSGDRQKAVGYYKKSSTTNSVRFICDDFVGTITLYGSLDEDPTADADWFSLYVFPTDDSSSLDGSTAISTDYSVSITGKFTWMKATVSSFTGGTINSVTLSY